MENARRLSPSDLRTTQSGHSQAHIARTIGVDSSAISRELARNTGARGYARQLVGTTICYVNRPLSARVAAKLFSVVHNPG
jgi:IS30 family transposase